MKLSEYKSICAFLFSVCDKIEEIVISDDDIKLIVETGALLQTECKAGGGGLISDCHNLVSSYNTQIRRSLQERIKGYDSYFSIHERIKTYLDHLERGKWDYRARTRKDLIKALTEVCEPCQRLHKICKDAFEYNPFEAKTLEQLFRRLGKEKALNQANRFKDAGYLDEDFFPAKGVTNQQMGLMGDKLCWLGDGDFTRIQIARIWGKPDDFISKQANKARSANSNKKNQDIIALT